MQNFFSDLFKSKVEPKVGCGNNAGYDCIACDGDCYAMCHQECSENCTANNGSGVCGLCDGSCADSCLGNCSAFCRDLNLIIIK